MIILKIKGGLGNQIFQYALARNLSLLNNMEMKFDLSYYKEQSFRSFSLDKFSYGKFITTSTIESYIWKMATKFNKFLKREMVVVKPKFGFDSKILNLKEPYFLDGYWQSEEYFKGIAETIKN